MNTAQERVAAFVAAFLEGLDRSNPFIAIARYGEHYLYAEDLAELLCQVNTQGFADSANESHDPQRTTM